MHRSLIIIALLVCAGPLAAQETRFSTEGKFQEVETPPTAEGAPAGSVRVFDVLSYQLALRLAMTEGILDGQMTVRLVLLQSADSVRLNAAALSLDTVRVDGLGAGITEYPGDEEVAISLGRLRPPGDTVSVEIVYRRLPEVSRPSSREGYYYFDTGIGIPANLGYTMSEPSDARFWMPCLDEPWEKATAEISITVPKAYVAASNGRLVGVESHGDGTRTWHWKEENQIAAYLMAVTVSEFTVSTRVFERGPGDTIPLQYIVWAEDSAECAGYLPTVHQMMTALSELFGPYPFDKYAMSAVTPFGFGGMEHQTITTLHRAYKTHEGVVVHELAHQWWGDLVTCGSWEDIWLNESFATYSEALWKEWRDGPQGLKDEMARKLTFQYGSWLGSLYDPVGQGFNLFANSVYSKGAWVLHTLRGVVGDSVFFRSLAAYRARHGAGSAITDDLRAVIDSVAGGSYRWFFDQWVYGVGWPTYAFRGQPHGDSVDVTLYQLQDPAWPTYTMPIRLRVVGAGRDTMVVVHNTLRTETFRIGVTFPVQRVDFDPDGWILKQMDDPPLSVEEGIAPSSFQLRQNYPNPFNPSTIIRYELPAAQHVTLTIVDLLGREVARLVDQGQSAGNHVVEFSGDRLAAGIYLCRLRTTPLDQGASGGYSAVRKMVLVK